LPDNAIVGVDINTKKKREIYPFDWERGEENKQQGKIEVFECEGEIRKGSLWYHIILRFASKDKSLPFERAFFDDYWDYWEGVFLLEEMIEGDFGRVREGDLSSQWIFIPPLLELNNERLETIVILEYESFHREGNICRMKGETIHTLRRETTISTSYPVILEWEPVITSDEPQIPLWELFYGSLWKKWSIKKWRDANS
jgi:hypothetical protein